MKKDNENKTAGISSGLDVKNDNTTNKQPKDGAAKKPKSDGEVSNSELANSLLDAGHSSPNKPSPKKRTRKSTTDTGTNNNDSSSNSVDNTKAIDTDVLSGMDSLEFDGKKTETPNTESSKKAVIEPKQRKKYTRRKKAPVKKTLEAPSGEVVTQVGDLFIAVALAKGSELVFKKPSNPQSFLLSKEEKDIIAPQVEAVINELTEGKEVDPKTLLAITLATIYGAKFISEALKN